jgi:HK97 gp10 family phage protein
MAKKYTISQFSDALSKLGKHVRKPVIAKAALAGGYTIEAHAKINVEKTFKPGTGNLSNSIITTLEHSDDTSAKVSVGPTVIYGRIQEFGGVIKPVTAKILHWVDEGGRHHQAASVTIPARPYLRPAVDENEDAIIKAVADNLRIEIEGQI